MIGCAQSPVPYLSFILVKIKLINRLLRDNLFMRCGEYDIQPSLFLIVLVDLIKILLYEVKALHLAISEQLT